jgi:hypothetical protein
VGIPSGFEGNEDFSDGYSIVDLVFYPRVYDSDTCSGKFAAHGDAATIMLMQNNIINHTILMQFGNIAGT